jgi:hypothetical protein
VIVKFSISRLWPRSTFPVPIPVAPEPETDAFTNESDRQTVSRPTPIPGPFSPPSAESQPPLFDETVTFDSAQSTAAEEEREFAVRNELNPSKTNEIELRLIKSGAGASTSTSKRTTVIWEFVREIANSVDLPTTVRKSGLIAAALPLQRTTELETTLSGLWLISHVRVDIGDSSGGQRTENFPVKKAEGSPNDYEFQTFVRRQSFRFLWRALRILGRLMNGRGVRMARAHAWIGIGSLQ